MHTTEQLNTALAGRYAIDRLVGEGGMATVYLARDVRHNRKVAVKVLRPDLGAVVGVDRFLSEIQVTANLQHPNLLPLFDSGEAGGLLFYVMPYIEGESLRARIAREKQLPIDAVVQITTSVASALDYAHRQGVIHRDLKPENILLHDGQPLVADFGIALAVSNAGGNRITQTGLSLGTPQYMSPEQATGDRTIDARTDIYSLGAVAYEMLTGEPPHTGTTSQAVIARMLTEQPRGIQASRPNVPVQIAAAVEHALEKLPADRWATAKEFSEALTGVRPITMSAVPQHGAGVATPMPRRTRVREVAGWVAAVLGVGITWVATRPAPAPLPVAGIFAVELPESVTVSSVSAQSVALSRDGRRLAILGERGPTRQIYLRRLEDPVVHPVRGTEDALYPAFSSDGQSLAFNVGSVLKTVSVDGGAPRTLAESVSTNAASWGDSRTVLYEVRGTLWRVSSDGGDRARVAAPDTANGIARVAYPQVLPGGTHAAVAWYSVNVPDSARLGIVRLSDGKLASLGIVGRAPHFVSTGHLVFARTGGFVFSVPFSLKKLAVTGPPVLLLEQMRQSVGGSSALAVAENGTIAYESGNAGNLTALVLVNRQGVERVLKGPLNSFREPRISPDGRRIAVRVGSGQYGGGLWIHEIASGVLSRLTGDSSSVRGEWTRDGKSVVFIAGGNTPSQRMSSLPWDGSGPRTDLSEAGAANRVWNIALGRTGGLSVLRMSSQGGAGDLYLAPTDSLAATRRLTNTAAGELDPRVSPNGRLVAYTSNNSGRNEVYMTPIPGPGPHVQVSVDGGQEAVWSPDGATLFYRAPARIMAAAVVERPMLAVVRRDSLFADVYSRNAPHAAWDVMPSGREFLMMRGPEGGSSIYVIVNWQQLGRVRGAAEQQESR